MSLLHSSAAWADRADLVWHASGVSPALERRNGEVSSFLAPPPSARIPASAAVTRISATRRFKSNAWVQSELCTASASLCVPMPGGTLNTDAFRGQPASQSYILLHKVMSWGGSSPPLFIRDSLTVWYQP